MGIWGDRRRDDRLSSWSQGIPTDLYEGARIDGRVPGHFFARHVTLPISPVIFTLVLGIVGVLSITWSRL